MSINVFAVNEENEVYPVKVVDDELEDHRDLLMLENGEVSHFATIIDFNRMVRFQITGHHGAIYVCKRCFTHYPNNDRLVLHMPECKTQKVARIIMPKPVLENGVWKKPQVYFNIHGTCPG